MSEPAFPEYCGYVSGELTTLRPEGGLTKREYFAAMAMQGFISAHPHNLWEKFAVRLEDGSVSMRSGDWFAQMSVIMADTILSELERRK